jgi:cytidylate kinase
VIARNEKDGRVVFAAPLKCFCQALPEIRAGIRIVENVANAEDCIYSIPARDVEDSPNYIHTGA